jgi:DUF1680 family protein
LRWSKEREEYISYCKCCPPNTVRTLTQVQNYAYTISNDAIYFQLYGGNTFTTSFGGKEILKIEQITDYPWDGKIVVKVTQAPKKKKLTFNFRIPSSV